MSQDNQLQDDTQTADRESAHEQQASHHGLIFGDATPLGDLPSDLPIESSNHPDETSNNPEETSEDPMEHSEDPMEHSEDPMETPEDPIETPPALLQNDPVTPGEKDRNDQGDRDEDPEQTPDVPNAPTQADEIKIIFTYRGDVATVAMKRPDTDTYIETFRDSNINNLLETLPAVLHVAEGHWDQNPKHPQHKPIPKTRARAKNKPKAQTSPSPAEPQSQDQPTVHSQAQDQPAVRSQAQTLQLL